MSIQDEWIGRDELVIDGDRFSVRCRSTFSGRRTEFFTAFTYAVGEGLLDGAVHLELCAATCGSLSDARVLLDIACSRPNPTIRTLSMGAALGRPYMPYIVEQWPKVVAAFSALMHGPEAFVHAATKPRVRVVKVGPHYVKVRTDQVFELGADGTGWGIWLRDPTPDGSPFDVLSLNAHVNSDNVAAFVLAPLEPDDGVLLNGKPVVVHPLVRHRPGGVERKGTVTLFPVRGDVIEVAGLAVRYEEEDAVADGAFAQREPHVVFMGRGPTNTTVALEAPRKPEEDDDD